FRRNYCLALAAVVGTFLALDQAQTLEFGDLSTDGRMVAPGSLGELHHTNWAEPLNADQDGEQRAVELNSCILNHLFIGAWAIHDADDSGHRFVQRLHALRHMCI